MAGRQRIFGRFIAVGLAGMLASGCVMNRASGRREFSLVSQSQELALGKQGDQEIRQQYGVYDHAAVEQYVQRLGKTIAAHSDQPELDWHFRVLDSPVVNAFALPGGYIYVTRGLLAYLENEAQLAVVIGHEIGHVTARHTAERITRQNVAGLGMGLGALFIPGLRPYMGILQTGMQLLFLNYSRGDESAADELGVKYATRAGYAAAQGARFFGTLKRLEDGKTGGLLPEWASTHPDPAQRETRVIALAAAANKALPKPATKGTDAATFLPRLERIVFGQDPRQGFVKGGQFIHPEMAFRFPVPSGWKVNNYPAKVELVPPDERLNARIILTGAQGATPEAAARAFVEETDAIVQSASPTTINGLPAYFLQTQMPIQTPQGGMVLRVGSVFIRKAGQIFAFHGYSPVETFGLLAGTIEGVAGGFAPVTDKALLNVQPKRLDIVNAPKTGAFQSVIIVPAGSPLSLDDLAVLNQKDLGTPVTTGMLLKLVR
jgi:predicted Zn-dependent protease